MEWTPLTPDSGPWPNLRQADLPNGSEGRRADLGMGYLAYPKHTAGGGGHGPLVTSSTHDSLLIEPSQPTLSTRLQEDIIVRRSIASAYFGGG